jgi:hypothetical protein
MISVWTNSIVFFFWPSTKPCEGRSIGAHHLKFLGPPDNEQEHDLGGGEASRLTLGRGLRVHQPSGDVSFQSQATPKRV